jgi:ribonuclease-3
LKDGLLERLLGYRFRDKGLLEMALTPPSAGLPHDNQRLEFLGDSVLQLCATRLVYDAHGDWREGALSKLRGRVVSTDALHAWALDLGVELGRGPRSPKRGAPSRKEMADAVEAILAAVALDAEAVGENGVAAAAGIIGGRFGGMVSGSAPGDWEASDPKTALQEKATAMGLGVPDYELVKREGPEHAPVFLCRAALGDLETAANGPTLKRAQKEAARKLLELVDMGAANNGAPPRRGA